MMREVGSELGMNAMRDMSQMFQGALLPTIVLGVLQLENDIILVGRAASAGCFPCY